MQTARNLHPIVATALVLLCVASAGGCGGGRRSVTIPAWQRNVEQYVKREGGDATVLRDVRLPDSRRGYSMLGADRPAESSDANGVLLGFRSISGRNWFIYLVGLVKQQKVEEIRLTALCADAGKFAWKMSSADSEALQKYRSFKQKQWRERFPQRGLPPPEYLGFPTADDHFQLNITDGHVTVVHTASGAQWELDISSPSKPRHAAGE